MTTTPKSRCVITVSRNFISLKSSEYLILICRDRDANESSLPVTNVEHDNMRPWYTGKVALDCRNCQSFSQIKEKLGWTRQKKQEPK